MQERQSFVTSLAALAGGGFVSRLFLIATELIVARSYGAEAFGAYSTALVFSTIFGFAITFGMDTYLLREISQKNEEASRILGDVYLAKFTLGIVVYGIMILTAVWLKYPSEVFQLITIFGIYVVLLSFQETIAAIFQSHQKMMPIAIFRLFQAIGIFALAFSVNQLGHSTYLIALGYLAVSLFITMLWYRRSRRLLVAKLRGFRLLLTLKHCYIFGLSGVLFILNYNFDTIMLSIMRTQEEVGYYSAAYKFVDILFKVPAIVSFAILPRLFAQYVTNKDRMFQTYETVFRYLVIAGALVTALLLSHALPIINFVYGEGYHEAVQVLQILSWSLLFTFMMAPTSDQLVSANQQKYNLIGWVIAVLANISANWFLIPHYGIIGAAWATFMSQLILYALLSYFLRRYVHQAHVLRQIPKPFFCLFLAYMTTLMIDDLVPAAVAVIITIATFLVGLFMTRAITITELRSFIPARR